MEPSTAQVNEVLKRAREAIKARPREPGLHQAIAPIYEQLGRHAEAAPHLAFLLSATDAPDETLYARYAKALQRAGNFAKAKQVLEEGLARYPQSCLLLKNLALTHSLRSEFEQALAAYRRIHALDASDTHSR